VGAARAGAPGGRVDDGLSVPADVVRVSGTEPDPAVSRWRSSCSPAGSLLIYPTDTLYALGGRVLDAAAGAAVRRAKGREGRESRCLWWPRISSRRARSPRPGRRRRTGWPPGSGRGPLSLVLPAARPPCPGRRDRGQAGNVAVRVPDLELTRALCRAAGPLVSTSANRAGGTPPITCATRWRRWGRGPPSRSDAGRGRAIASTIVDLTSTPPRLVRGGAIPWEEIEGVLRPSAG
jgi:L-threonylcarbamoyladenylate synthase